MGAGGAPGEVGIEPGDPTVVGGCGLRGEKGSGDLEGNDCGGTDDVGGEGVGEGRGEVGVIGKG